MSRVRTKPEQTTEVERWLEDLDPGTTPAEDITDLAAIGAAMEAVVEADHQLREAVQHARANGRSWSRIAMILGTTKQSAHERFGPGSQRSERL